MDPTLAPGDRASIQAADLRLLQLSGWQVDFTPLSIKQTDNATPQSFALGQNYPNPFNPSTTIKYQLASAGTVSLKVFDVLGREVETLVQAKQPAGTYEAAFNAAKLSSGIYFYQLRAGSFNETKKMMLVK
ncbi:MAG: T9SS type A sorting domain-containing protein [Rhizobacter sp.]|nr:T9SS type A sorting domain-containing protein [Chlorobiales bacterium]